MRLLILGAAGFVGRHLARECRERGDEITGTFRPGESVPEIPGVEWRPLELLDESSVDSAFEAARPEGMIHLAGQANVQAAARDPLTTFQINAGGTVGVLASLRRMAPEARAVIVTSAEVYGPVSVEELPVSESRPLAPGSAYGVTKAAADFAAEQAARVWDLSVVRMRPFNHIGPGQRLGFVAPDFASQVARIERGEEEPTLSVGNLSARRDFTDVRDIVRGYRDALDHGRSGAAYNLCSGRSVAIEEIVRFFLDRALVPIEIHRDESRVREIDVPEFRGDASLAREELGWTPRISFEESLAEVLAEWRERGARAPGPAD